MAPYGLVQARAVAGLDVPTDDGGVGVLIDGTRIDSIRPLAHLELPTNLAWTLGTPDRGIITGGFVNGHHHALRPYRFGKTPPMEMWLVKARQRKLPSLSEEELYDHTLLGGVLTVRGGGTSLLDHFPVDWALADFGVGASARAYDDLGIRAAMCLTVNDQCRFVYEDDDKFLARLPGGLAGRAAALYRPFDSQRFFATWMRLNDNWGFDRSRIRLGFGPSGPQWCSDPLLEQCREVANAVGGDPIQIHLLESGYQAVYGMKNYGMSAVRHLRELGFWDGDAASAAHCVWCGEDDLKILADSGVTLIHNPSSNMQLQVGVAPVTAALDIGVRVGIGCDSGGQDLNIDMLTEKRFARDLQPPQRWGGATVSSEQILRCMGNGGAGAVGFDSQVGELKAGAPGDVVIIDDSRMKQNPYGSFQLSTADLVISRARAGDVTTVIVGGRPVLIDGAFVTVDEVALHARVWRSLERFADALLGADDDYRVIEPYIASFYSAWERDLADLASGLGHRRPV